MAYEMVLMRADIVHLNTATKAVIKYKSYKRCFIQVEEILIVSKVLDLITKREGSRRKEGKELAKRVRAGRRCGCCGEIRHNSRTYKVEIKDINNSDASK